MMDRAGGTEDGEDSAILIPLHEARRERLDLPVTFQRRELDQMLRLYGRMVAANEWRDYAIDHLPDRAVFSVFRRTTETPLFQIVKDPALARRQGTWSVVAGDRPGPEARPRTGPRARRLRQDAAGWSRPEHPLPAATAQSRETAAPAASAGSGGVAEPPFMRKLHEDGVQPAAVLVARALAAARNGGSRARSCRRTDGAFRGAVADDGDHLPEAERSRLGDRAAPAARVPTPCPLASGAT